MALKPMERNEELEAAILADPDNKDAYLVYADWLQSRGELWGEVISLQIAAEDEKNPKGKIHGRARSRLRDLFYERCDVPRQVHEGMRYPALNKIFKNISWRWGFVETVAFNPKDDEPYELPELSAPTSERGWSLYQRDGQGFLEALALCCDAMGLLSADCQALATWVRSLRELDLGVACGKVTDLWPLALFAELEELELSWREEHIKDLSPLVGLEKLRIINIENTEIPDEAMEAFRRARPDVEVKEDPSWAIRPFRT